MNKILDFTIVLLLAATISGCSSQVTPTEKFASLSTVQINSGDTPEMYGTRLVAWYPELGQAIVGQYANERLHLQSASQNNLNSFQVLETQAAAISLGIPIGSSGWATWGSGWATWGSGWATWGSGQSSVFQTGENQATWSQIRLREGRAYFTKLGEGVKIAVIDTGIDLQHPAFASRLVPANERYDFVDDDTVPQEVRGQAYGHGTNIAGIIAQIAEKAQIMPLRVLNGDGKGDSDDVVAAINWAVQNGARVINLSLGTIDSEAVALALDNATRKGIFVVTASGNSGDNNVNFPAKACGSSGKTGRWGDLAISVASVDRGDKRSKFSSFGKDDVGMSAPGELIYAPAPDNQVAAWSGTSMATPMVAASLALAIAQKPNGDVRKIGKAVREKSKKIDSKNNEQQIGKGRLDLESFAAEIKKLK